MMETALTKVAEMQAPEGKAEPQRRRRPRRQSEEVARYFLAKEGSSVEKPELGTEVVSEGEALIKAFQSKNGVIYAVLAYKAEAEIQGGSRSILRYTESMRNRLALILLQKWRGFGQLSRKIRLPPRE